MNYLEFFETKTRCDGTNFTCLTDGAPGELHELICSIHLDDFCGALPNDWIYSEIRGAFEALMKDSRENVSIEADVFNNDLIDWLKNPFALDFCDEAKSQGLVGEDVGLLDWITYGQFVAKECIYDRVNEFVKEQAKEGV
jgi:hypothetical protein